MTISSDSIKNSYSTTDKGTDSELPITFSYFDNSEIEVYLRTSAGVESKWALTTNYTIVGSPGASPKVKLVTDPADSGTIVIRRKTPFTQLVDYAAGDAFPADSHETALDRVVALAQQLSETLDRSFTYPKTYENPVGRSIEIPEPENNAVLKWNSDATAIVNDTDLATAAYKVKVTSNELTANYLDAKFVGGTGLTKATTDNPSGEETITFNVDAAQTQITSVGALAGGSIASGFGTISTTNSITTTGAVSAATFAGAALDNTTTLGSATDKAATQNAVKTYVDNQVAAINDDATTSNKGVASFNNDSFSVSSGHVSLKEGAVLDNPVIKGDDVASGSIVFQEDTDNGSHTATIKCPEALAGNAVVTLPGATTTLVGTDTTDTLTNKTLNGGSITSGFGNIDTGSSTITTTGLISGGSLDIDNVLIDSNTIGHTDDTDLITLTNGLVTVAGEISVTTLDLGGTDVTSNANELNLLDGSAKSTSSITIADDDAFLVIDGTTSKQIPASDIKTYAGGGGGAGSIDTLFTMQAKSADAAYTAIGNGYVWGNNAVGSPAGGSLTNATLALETTDLDLIQDTKVFAYDSGGSGVRNWWYHEQAIQTGYGGKNMILQLQYFTRNCADSNIFRFYARDAAKPVFTSDGSADAGTNQILGAVAWDASLSTSSPDDRKAAAVGDRIVIVDTSNNIHYRYITAVSPDDRDEPGALTITYSGADIAPANSTVMLIGVMTDELDYLPANNMAAAGNNEAKVYRKQMQFPEGCRLFQFGFHVESTDVDVELYYDDIALSANQFLQTSSVGETQSVQLNTHAGTHQTYTPYFTNTVTNTITSDYGTFTNESGGGSYTHFEAAIKCEVTMSVWQRGNASGDNYVAIIKNDLSATDPSGSGLNNNRVAYGKGLDNDGANCSARVVLNKGDTIRPAHASGGTYSGDEHKAGMLLTVTPLVNDVVLLNSQDEIFTDWVSYTPTWFNSPTVTNQQVFWRRNGPSLEIKGRMQLGSAPASTMGFSLPSGLSIDISKIGGEGAHDVYLPSRFIRVTSTVKYNNANSNSCGLFFDKSQATKTTNLFVGTNHNAQSGDCIDSVDYNNFGGSGDGIEFYAHGIPIAGWTSTFNPVLSMPLVDFGTFENTYSASIAEDGSITSQSGSFIASVNRGSAGVYTITYVSGFFAVEPAVQATLHTTRDERDIQIDSTNSSATGCEVECYDPGGSTPESNGFFLTVSRQGSDYRQPPQPTAAVIKPAVAVVKDVKAYNANGGTSAGGGWQTRTLNTIDGESWFVSLNSGNNGFTLDPGAYEINAQAPGQYCNAFWIQLYSNTNSAMASEPGQVANSQVDGGQWSANLSIPYLAVTSAEEFAIHQYTGRAQSNNGLGIQGGVSGYDSVYTTVQIRKLK